MSKISRRTVLASASAAGLLASQQGLAQSAKLTLEPSGSPRRLPHGLFSASLESMIEHLMDDPKKVDLLAQMKLGHGRFPGGSESDFYDWRTGKLALTTKPNSSGYVKYWANVVPNINSAWPNGVHYEQYAKFCQNIGAEALWVPNLETSTLDEQVAWVKDLADKGAAPRFVEMGNEFYVALLFDPDSMAHWPNEPATRKIIRQYADAFRPYLPKDVKIATQAGPESFGVWNTETAVGRRMQNWNDQIKSEDWFDAITIHLYCQLNAMTDAKDTSNAVQAKAIFDAVMAHHDDGMEKALNTLGARVPGKEIWITEWSPRGGDPTPGPHGRDSITHSMYMQAVARAQFTMLRIPQVTVSLFFMFNFTLKPIFAVFNSTPDGGFAPMPPAIPVIWFAQAANGGVEYQRFLEKGGERVSGNGKLSKSYAPIEGALFKGDTTTLLVQNASAAPRALQLPPALSAHAPTKIETLAMSDLTDQTRAAAKIATLPAGPRVELPAYSLTRFVWAA